MKNTFSSSNYIYRTTECPEVYTTMQMFLSVLRAKQTTSTTKPGRTLMTSRRNTDASIVECLQHGILHSSDKHESSGTHNHLEESQKHMKLRTKPGLEDESSHDTLLQGVPGLKAEPDHHEYAYACTEWKFHGFSCYYRALNTK